MKYIAKTTALVCLLVVLTSLLFGCGYRGYKGDHPEAYTLAYTQIPGTRGAREIGPGFDDPQILLIETDSLGRGLYLYYESSEGPISIVIVQKATEEKVYFYPEDSALSFRTPDDIYDVYDKKLSKEKLTSLYRELCSDEVLAKFKEANDWNKPIDENKLDSAEITIPKISNPWSNISGKLSAFIDWREYMLSLAVKNGHNVPEGHLNGSNGMNIYTSYMATDSYGRELYYVQSSYYVYSEDGVYPSTLTEYYLEMLAIINPDGSFDKDIFMVELEDKLNWQEQMRELKEANGWNKPIGEGEK
ncbi:MAG: hypothetical protein IJX97_06755 [Clostridia bacterium]|nr:hypothetical protein [Clostridia bacterium]